MQKRKFYVTDDYNRGFIFVGSEEQIRGLQELCMSSDFAPNLIKIEDELGIFAIPLMQGTFTPNEDNDYVPQDQIPQWMSEYMPGFHLEFIDENGVPYFSTCDGLELWYKEHYEWYSEVLRLNELINELHTKMMFSCKKDICRYEKSMATIYKKLDDMDFDCVDVIATFSTPIKRYRHVYSESDMELALHEVTY